MIVMIHQRMLYVVLYYVFQRKVWFTQIYSEIGRLALLKKCWMLLGDDNDFVHFCDSLSYIRQLFWNSLLQKRGAIVCTLLQILLMGCLLRLFMQMIIRKEGQLDREWGLVWPKIRNVFEKQSRWPGPPSWLRIN